MSTAKRNSTLKLKYEENQDKAGVSANILEHFVWTWSDNTASISSTGVFHSQPWSSPELLSWEEHDALEDSRRDRDDNWDWDLELLWTQPGFDTFPIFNLAWLLDNGGKWIEADALLSTALLIPGITFDASARCCFHARNELSSLDCTCKWI